MLIWYQGPNGLFCMNTVHACVSDSLRHGILLWQLDYCFLCQKSWHFFLESKVLFHCGRVAEVQDIGTERCHPLISLWHSLQHETILGQFPPMWTCWNELSQTTPTNGDISGRGLAHASTWEVRLVSSTPIATGNITMTSFSEYIENNGNHWCQSPLLC